MNGEDTAPESTSLIDLIDRLVEPPAPPPVSLMPQTWGWVVLAVLLALLAAWLVWRAVGRWRDGAYRRAALAELDAAGDDPAAIAAILRRTALAAWPREEVASLSGEEWLAFLDSTGDGGFAGGPGAALLAGPYRQTGPAPGLGDLAARWIRRHRVTP